MHNNLQFAHQLRVLTNYGDINGGSNGGGWTGAGVGEEGGGEACVSQNTGHTGDECSLLYRTAPRDFRARFPSLENNLFAFVDSIRSTLHLRISTISTKSTCIYIYI